MKPALMPAQPSPATARPAMKISDRGATAQTSEPSSNIAMEERRMVLVR